MSWHVDALLTGKAKAFRDGEKSAIGKTPATGAVRITTLGLGGDEQADPAHHGGPHMAVHHYPRDHHAFWRDQIGDHPLLDDPGAFGSNLSVSGLVDSQVRLGDRFRLGSAVVEVSQPRMPCWKIEHRFQRKAMVATIIKSGKSGWYYRVIEEGEAQAGDRLELVSTGASDWTVEHILQSIANPKVVPEIAELEAMAECELLGPSWRGGARKKIAALG
ncbi:MOSC domain-containing protein [Pontixanthobacter aquaemixtae]|uniref:MOSC domain-containing protein n=1 Tax=Pontixanthobacter aquaemixtae TaxID=1958940 RepID=A0A844ZRU7_9SPHN|nr:MOSC domain-containing protein [Pontixanthobacter aquaemixtae]MXO90575.1 MOSC domain-containing protein [Pontixanthobacter aquaemixtae]